MAKLPRVTQKIFAQNSGTNDVTVFGTAKNGNDAVFTKDINQIMNSDAFSQGWGSATLTDDAPFQEDMNGVQLALSQQLAYFFENGMPEWDENTTYYTNTSFCQVNGVWYQSLTDNNIGNNPVNDTTNWYKIDLDKLNPDLSNLSTPGLDKINQSKALETGSVSSDADVYADIQKYAHSTFDLSKFEVVGSPNITDDGMASNLKSSNYILIPEACFVMSNLKDKSWTIKGKWVYTGQEIESGTDLFINLSTGEPSFGSFSVDKERLSANVTYKLEGETSIRKLELQFSELLTECDISFSFDINTYTYTATINGESTSYTSNEHRQLHWIAQENQRIRIGYGYGDYYCRNATDLKSLSISIDGLPVFSGNKTGVDVIKPDNYEVVGTPTITDDGMFNNNSSDKNLIKIPLTYGDFLNKSWEVRTCAYVVPNVSKSYIVFDNNYSSLGSLVWSSGLKICAKFGDASDSTGEIYVAPLSTSTPEGWYNLSMAFNYTTGEYTCKAINIATGTVYSNTYTPTTANKQLHTFNTKTSSTKINLIRSRSELITDLNGVQVYFDGDLAYQLCLKIPYTLSNTGSKIVDVYARNRVQDLYEQTGEALYYTIDEENQNFTLPMGEIYGMIERKNNELNNPFSLFDYKYTDAPIYNASWLKADGTFYAKSVYVSAYEALVVENNSDITAGTTTTLPSGGSYTKRGLSVKLSTASYTDTDFVINTTDETFRLPLTTKAVPFAGGSFPVVGTGIALGLTNARDSRVLTLQSNSDGAEINVNGGGQTLPYNAGGINRPENGYVMGLSKDSSKSGVVANVSGTTGLNLYFYVGETVQNAYLIDAGQIAENMDGSWTFKLLVLENNTTIATDSTGKLYDLSDYLPEDNNVYEILFAAAIRTGAQTNSYIAISQQVGSSWGILANGITRTNSYLETGGSAIGIIMSDRKLQMSWTATVSSGTLLYLRILAYRKVR